MKTVRTLMRSLREYRGPSLQAPLFMVGEAGLECILPLMMAELIDTLTDGAMGYCYYRYEPSGVLWAEEF